MKASRKAALAGIALVPLVAGGFLLQSRDTRTSAQLLDQVLALVSDRYVDTLDSSQLYEKAARGLVEQLNDPYSELFSPKELQGFTRETAGHYGGLGMRIEQQEDQVVVVTVFPNTPAAAAGVREGDRIIQVDSLSTRGWKLDKVSDYLTGTPGTAVSATFARPGVPSPITLQFTRAVIHVPAVPFDITFGKVGYLPLQQFSESAASEVHSAILDLQKKGAKSVIIDLRGNPGGYLEQALDMGNLFLHDGQEIVSVRGRDMHQSYDVHGTPTFADIPVVILTNGGTASAAEIVSGAMQDHDRALIIGQPTFGKGLVQTVYPLDGGWALKLTTAKWYTPSGRSIQKERQFVNGHFVATKSDTTQATELSVKSRPVYHSDDGRVVYGGGGIVPDVVVTDDTLTTAEQTFNKAVASKTQEEYVTLYDYALELAKQVKSPDFTVKKAWLDTLYSRLQAKGVQVSRAQYDGASRYIGHLLEEQVAQAAFGDSVATRHNLRFDAPLEQAIDLLRQTGNQKNLFGLADAARMAQARKAGSPGTAIQKP